MNELCMKKLGYVKGHSIGAQSRQYVRGVCKGKWQQNEKEMCTNEKLALYVLGCWPTGFMIKKG